MFTMVGLMNIDTTGMASLKELYDKLLSHGIEVIFFLVLLIMYINNAQISIQLTHASLSLVVSNS